MNFQLSSTSSQGSFDLLNDQGTLLANFQYENWFSSVGTARFGDNHIAIRPRNIWQSAFDVFVNEVDKGDITFNWQGNILIRLEQRGLTTNYRLKSKGFWKFKFVLEDEQQTPVLQLEPAFEWSKMGYNYRVEQAETATSIADSDLIVLLLACGYGANLYMSMMVTAAS